MLQTQFILPDTITMKSNRTKKIIIKNINQRLFILYILL